MPINTNYKIVLSDKLYTIYKKASVEKLNSKETKACETLLSNLELDVLTNYAQLERCKNGLPEIIYDDLSPILLADEINADLKLTELAKNTLYKLILTQEADKNSPPYFNINNKNITRSYTISCLHNESRDYLVNYLRQLLTEANQILIFDNYFSESKDNLKFLELLPDNLTLNYVENSNSENGEFIKNYAKDANKKWSIDRCDTRQPELNRFARSHDRYLIIDDQLEIILSSGFSYLWNTNKEITCVFRNIL